MLPCNLKHSTLLISLQSQGSEFSSQHVVLTQSVLDTERAELAVLNTELRAVRGEFDRLEREKRASSNPPPAARSSYYITPAVNGQSSYYRPYPYTYGIPASSTTTSSFPIAPPAGSTSQQVNPPIPATLSTYPANSAIPVQLPLTAMPALSRLGIVPIPAASVADGQPAPPAILRGTSSNGMLNIEINISLLQPTQMSGLALILNSLMSRGPSTTSTPTTSAPVLSLSPPAPPSSATELRLAPPDKT